MVLKRKTIVVKSSSSQHSTFQKVIDLGK